MTEGVVKRSITIAGHRTSVSVEDAFWKSLKTIAAHCDLSIAALISEIDSGRGKANLSSAIRLFVLAWYQAGKPEDVTALRSGAQA